MTNNVDSMKSILRIILTGYTIHEKSWNGGNYEIGEIPAMIKAAGDAEQVGYTAYLMSHNMNDIQEQAEVFGLGYDREGNVIDLPPRECDDTTHWASWDIPTQEWIYRQKVKSKKWKKDV